MVSDTSADSTSSTGGDTELLDVPYRTIVAVLPDETVVERTPENDNDRFSGTQQEQVAMRLVRSGADLSSAVDQLRSLNTIDPANRSSGRLDLQRLGVVGHSLGRATALQFCHDDARCKADIDGAPIGSVTAEGVRKPFMFLLSDHTGEPDAPEVPAKIDAIYNRLSAAQRSFLTMRAPTISDSVTTERS